MSEESLYEGSDRLLKADGSTNIHNNPYMSCSAIRKQKYTDSTLLEPTEAGKFETVAITFKMDAKKNDRNEHEQKKSPLTSIPLSSRPHSLLFFPSKSILFYASTLLIDINLANIESCW